MKLIFKFIFLIIIFLISNAALAQNDHSFIANKPITYENKGLKNLTRIFIWNEENKIKGRYETLFEYAEQNKEQKLFVAQPPQNQNDQNWIVTFYKMSPGTKAEQLDLDHPQKWLITATNIKMKVHGKNYETGKVSDYEMVFDLKK